jgi:hypothetical protein
MGLSLGPKDNQIRQIERKKMGENRANPEKYENRAYDKK